MTSKPRPKIRTFKIYSKLNIDTTERFEAAKKQFMQNSKISWKYYKFIDFYLLCYSPMENKLLYIIIFEKLTNNKSLL